MGRERVATFQAINGWGWYAYGRRGRYRTLICVKVFDLLPF